MKNHEEIKNLSNFGLTRLGWRNSGQYCSDFWEKSFDILEKINKSLKNKKPDKKLQ